MVENLYYKLKHYNVQFNARDLVNRVTARDLCELSPHDNAWVWVVEERRHATQEEIWELCKPA